MTDPTPTRMFAHHLSSGLSHIFHSTMQVRMCGDEDVVAVDVTESEDGTYWGWRDTKGRLSMIYWCFEALSMCFPYGIEAEEERGNGIRVQLNVVLSTEPKKENE